MELGWAVAIPKFSHPRMPLSGGRGHDLYVVRAGYTMHLESHTHEHVTSVAVARLFIGVSVDLNCEFLTRLHLSVKRRVPTRGDTA